MRSENGSTPERVRRLRLPYVDKPFHTSFRFAIHLAMLALSLPLIAGVAAGTASADASRNAPGEMLQDGLDALFEHQRDLAADLFEQLIAAFPGTPEATRAERELNSLSEDNQRAPANGVDAPFVQRASDAELRMTFATEAGDRVFFAENSAVIGGRARALIEHQARWLVKRPDLKVTIVGRSDDGLPAEAARDIAEKRAAAVRDRLVANGVTANRVAIETRGARDPIATCTSPLCQAQNRHAETVIGTTSAAGLPVSSGPISTGPRRSGLGDDGLSQ